MNTAVDRQLWDPTLETMSADELHTAIEQPRLCHQLQHAIRHSPYWRDRFTDAGIREGDIGAGFELSSMPLTEKADLLRDQMEHPPYGRLPAVPLDQVRRVHRTSGTSARPFFTLLTEHDVETTTEAGARAFWCAGVRPDDVVVHCLNYCLWSGGVTDHLCLERTGATVIPYGVGGSRYLLELIRSIRPTALSCTPSYLERLAQLLRDELGVTPASLGLRKALLGGEGGVQSPAFRESIEREWGMQAVDANYGMSDVLSIFGSECPHRTGLHFHGQGLLLPELINPHTLRNVSLEGDATGELVLTHLVRDAQPLIRFRTRDLIRINGVGGCPCGRRGLRFTVLGRSDDMLVIKGVNVFPSAIKDIIARFADELTGAFRVLADGEEPRVRMMLKVEVRSSVPPSRRSDLRRRLEEMIHQHLSVRADLRWVDQNSLERTEGKTQLVSELTIVD